VLKAMGAESDQEVVDLIGPDEQLAALLMPSLQVSSIIVDVTMYIIYYHHWYGSVAACCIGSTAHAQPAGELEAVKYT
jgi:hypothetical protein